MKIGFDQIRFGQAGPEKDLASHANAIINSNRVLRLASELAPDATPEGDVGRYTNAVVAEYGRVLSGPIQYMVRHSVVFDAAILPFEKETIRSALLDCAAEPSFGPEELALLGEMHFYLSHFLCGMTAREAEADCNLFAEQNAEGAILRAEWLEATAYRRRSKMSQFFSTWLKPNA